MKKKFTAFAVIFLLIGTAQSVKAESTLEFMESCRELTENVEFLPDGMVSLPDNNDAGYCWGVFKTWQQLHTNVATSLGDCLAIPDEVTLIQIVLVFEKFVKDNPAQGHLDFGKGIYNSLKDSWGC